MSNSLWPHGLWHARFPCPSPSPRVYTNLCSLSQWCHPMISSSDIPFSYRQYFPASGAFPLSQLFTSCGQSTRASASASILPKNIQGWFPLGQTGWMSFSKGLSRFFSFTTIWKHQLFGPQHESPSIHLWNPQQWLLSCRTGNANTRVGFLFSLISSSVE